MVAVIYVKFTLVDRILDKRLVLCLGYSIVPTVLQNFFISNKIDTKGSGFCVCSGWAGFSKVRQCSRFIVPNRTF